MVFVEFFGLVGMEIISTVASRSSRVKNSTDPDAPINSSKFREQTLSFAIDSIFSMIEPRDDTRIRRSAAISLNALSLPTN